MWGEERRRCPGMGDGCRYGGVGSPVGLEYSERPTNLRSPNLMDSGPPRFPMWMLDSSMHPHSSSVLQTPQVWLLKHPHAAPSPPTSTHPGSFGSRLVNKETQAADGRPVTQLCPSSLCSGLCLSGVPSTEPAATQRRASHRSSALPCGTLLCGTTASPTDSQRQRLP